MVFQKLANANSNVVQHLFKSCLKVVQVSGNNITFLGPHMSFLGTDMFLCENDMGASLEPWNF